jgi:hypothetical protein
MRKALFSDSLNALFGLYVLYESSALAKLHKVQVRFPEARC